MANWKRQQIRNIPAYQRNEDLENLYVFGYQCKLFRDDERARYIDQGRHLIPWMGDPSLMIDRYDGRGHLHDIKPHDSDHVSSRSNDLTEEDLRVEQLCEDERYLELHTDLVQKAMYEEEELKRLNEAISDGYSAVGFNYDYRGSNENEETQEEEKEEEEPFYAPPELQLPTDVVPPETVKQNAIIEKTANFVSKQGVQMEIMIKTKQKDNTLFEFLDFGNFLNPYYKHMVKMIKSGKYKSRNQQKERQNSTDENRHGYLHPSLVKTTESMPVVKEQTREEFINSVASKVPSGQIENTPYAKLLSNLTKHTGRNSLQPSVRRTKGVVASQGYVDSSSHPSHTGLHPTETAQSHATGQGYQEYTQQENLEYLYGAGGPAQPPVPGMEPVHLPRGSNGASGQSVLPGQPPHPGTMSDSPVGMPDDLGYSNMDPVHGPQVVPPPPDLQPVIDKMAIYVVKNGPEFEMIVQKKKDERFEFLIEGHVHNHYYEHKKSLYQQEMDEAKALEAKKSKKSARSVPSDIDTKEDKHMQNKSISFSLRAKDVENLPMGLRTTALLYESSEEEEDNSDERETKDAYAVGHVAPSLESIQNQFIEQSLEVTTKPVMSGISSEDMEKKQAESRLKDKLAMAAREKLAQTSKENQIKAERKRKAAMFINMLKSVQPPGVSQEKQENSDTGHASENVVASVPGSPQLSEPASPAPTPAPSTICQNSHSINPCPVGRNAPHSPVVTKSYGISRSKSRSPRRRRSRSPLMRRKSRSPRKHRKRSVTPPSAYTVRRRSVSPLRKANKRSRSRTPARYKRSVRSRSKERNSTKSRSKKSRSRSKTRTKSPSRSRKRSRSKSKAVSRKASRSRSRNRKRSRSKTRSKRRSRSPSKSRKSKSKKKTKSPSRSPKRKKSHQDKKTSRSKHSSSKKHDDKARHRKSHPDKKVLPPTERPDSIVIDDVEDSSPVHRDGGIISDSSTSSSPEVAAPSDQSPCKPRTADTITASTEDTAPKTSVQSSSECPSSPTHSPEKSELPTIKSPSRSRSSPSRSRSSPSRSRSSPSRSRSFPIKPKTSTSRPPPSLDMFAD